MFYFVKQYMGEYNKEQSAFNNENYDIMKTTTLAKLWFPVFLWCSLIFYLSGIPDLSSGLENIYDLILRKAAHIAEYAILTLLLLRAIANSCSTGASGTRLLSGLLSVLYAVSDELHQSFIPTRCPRCTDVLIDSIGVVIVILIFNYKGRQTLRKIKKLPL